MHMHTNNREKRLGARCIICGIRNLSRLSAAGQLPYRSTGRKKTGVVGGGDIFTKILPCTVHLIAGSTVGQCLPYGPVVWAGGRKTQLATVGACLHTVAGSPSRGGLLLRRVRRFLLSNSRVQPTMSADSCWAPVQVPAESFLSCSYVSTRTGIMFCSRVT